MKSIVFTLLVLVLAFTACTSTTTSTSTSVPLATAVPAATATLAPSATATPPATRAPVASPSPVVSGTPTPTAVPVVAAPKEFFLEVAAPKDESVVRESPVLVRGETVPDAVVSVNGQMAEVDADGNFSVAVALEQGPNPIEVIASDFNGNQQSRVIAIIYTP